MDNPYQAPAAIPDDERRFVSEIEPRRPTAVVVFSVLCIVFGSLKLLCAPISVIGYVMPTPPGQQDNPALQMLADPSYRSVMLGMVVVDVIAGFAMLTAGIGMLGLRPWSRRLAIVYGYYAIITSLINIGFTWVFLIGPLMKAAQRKGDAEATGAAIGSAFGGMIGSALVLVFPILLLIFMYRPRIVRAFQSPAFESDGPPVLTPL